MEIQLLLAVIVPALTLDPKSINLDLETSILLEPKDAKGNSFINSVKTFIDDLQQVLDPKPNLRAQDNPKFTDVIDGIAKVLLNFTDGEVEKLSKMMYKKAKGLKRTEDDGFLIRNLKQNVKNTLKVWARKPPAEIKDCIKLYLQHENGYFIDYIINKIDPFLNDKDIEYMKNKLDTTIKTNSYRDLYEVVAKIIDIIFNNKETNLKDEKKQNEDIIVAGRLKKENLEVSGKKKVSESKVRDEKKTKYKDEEIILNKNIEMFVRAAD